jgi:queuine tRNA-ribosyltransferase
MGFIRKDNLSFIHTDHGVIECPAFVFCATRGVLKSLPTEMIPFNTQILLNNTFHLQNYSENIEKMGGIHKFMNWNKPTIADSGGFQIFSLGHGYIADEVKGIRRGKNHIVKINEDGCYFKNPINGDIQFLSAEISMKIQHELGVDLLISFDECTASNSGYDYTKQSMERSKRWTLRSLNKLKELNDQKKLYGIIQGGVYRDLRIESIDFVNSHDFFGHAIGGSLGKTKEEMYDIVKFIAERLVNTRPIHLLGIGEIDDIIELSDFINTFDCVEPTRIARHGVAVCKGRKLNLRRSRFKNDENSIDSSCECMTCKSYSRAYLHYLLRIHELNVANSLITIHNMFTMNKLMEEIRNCKKSGLKLYNLKCDWVANKEIL